jgi:hypothetical protein
MHPHHTNNFYFSSTLVKKEQKNRWSQKGQQGIGGGRRRARTLALSWAMIFMRSASMLPSFFSDSSTSSGRTTFDDDPIPSPPVPPPNHPHPPPRPRKSLIELRPRGRDRIVGTLAGDPGVAGRRPRGLGFDLISLQSP